nr:natural cytotoxicity triggering receptor 3 ligand 1 isoform X2 [Vicugna pacos]
MQDDGERAHPVSSLFLEKVKDNEDRHILCKSTGFYPENINITWKRWTQKDLQYQEVSEGIITGPTVKNEDVTFNVTSYLSLRPALEDSVTSYRCVVWHGSLLTGQSFNLTLPLIESEKKTDLKIVGLCIGLLFIVLILLILVFFVKGTGWSFFLILFEEETKAFTTSLDSVVVCSDGFNPSPFPMSMSVVM